MVQSNQNQDPNNSSTSRRGFASMDEARQREIASKGGKMAHAKGTAHEFNSEEGRQAGRKGGEMVSQNRSHMAEIGRRGGEASGSRRNPGGAPRDSEELRINSDQETNPGNDGQSAPGGHQ